MLTLRPGRISRWAVLGLLLVSTPAAAARVPQPRELEASLRRLDLPRDTSTIPVSRSRFPLHFPLVRHHGRWRSADNSLLVAIHGHGHSARRYRSISLELSLGDSAKFQGNLAATERVITTIGLPDAVRAAAAEMLRVAHALQLTKRMTGEAGYYPVMHEPREVAGIQIRMRFGGLSHALLHFTDADAPEARWPTRDDVEQFHPHSHRHVMDIPADYTVFQDAIMLSLHCQAAGPDAFRCRYVLDDAGREGGRRVDATFSGLFRKAAYGWTVTLDQPPTVARQ